MGSFSAYFHDASGWATLGAIIFLLLMTNACHEGGHALLAWATGDRRPSVRRRCSLNPVKHFHWLLTFVLPVGALWASGGTMMFGGAKPVLVDRSRIGRGGMILTALAGPAGNILCAGFLGVGLAAAIHQEWFGLSDIDRIHSRAWVILKVPIWFSLFLAGLNLLPLPGLDGGHVVGQLLPSGAQIWWYRAAPLGILAVLGLLFYFSGYLHGWGWLSGPPPKPWPFAWLDRRVDLYLDALISWMGTKL